MHHTNLLLNECIYVYISISLALNSSQPTYTTYFSLSLYKKELKTCKDYNNFYYYKYVFVFHIMLILSLGIN